MLLPYSIAAGVALAVGGGDPPQPSPALAIVGATIIDGNGGKPLADGVVLIRDGKIAAVGARTEIKIPADAHVVDGTGRFAVPGFIDTNVHL